MKIYIETLGCSKNQVDSEKISYILKENNYEIVDSPDDASCIIVNTCAFIKKAREEAINTIFELLKYKEKKCKKFIVCGCLAQKYYKEIKEEIKEVDAIFGIGDISKIVEVIKENRDLCIPDFKEDNFTKREITGFPGTAYLRISDGCNNYCSYCSIPSIRGNLRSRSKYSILKELEFLKSKDIKEIILIAQDTTNYGLDLTNKRELKNLILDIEKNLEKEDWLRILYMHPDHIDDELLYSLSESRNFIPYFDIPFQSGSDRILKLMNRKGNSENYLKLLEKIRKKFKNPVIRSTFITGFPSETEEDHQKSLEFIKMANLDWVGGFEYSEEEGTKAIEIKNFIKERTKKKRLKLLLDIAEEISYKNLQRFLNKKERVIIEEKIENESLYLGRFYGQAPEVDGLTVIESEEIELKPGNFYEVTLKKLNGKDFFAFL
ncbi:MAG TPA: 30S ribosomal protein S12 methylthiotransferase RimO [Spirochaetota bacterium]|nr:30S ribosomal protein S12 methylthiotransferase RimO [Spirochaetota bacterium]HOL57373.1 30S ribosomal protein S12 methylthiotransferase RimO [Spirochaetota bacterium]HPP04932.1 30S ribosomal protein S12 methylthiotransferase RimO [Spirochaetota bacterium]